MHGTVRPPRAAGALRACVALIAAWAVVGASCEPSLHTVRVASGLAAPVYLTAPPGDARLFVLERAGTIRIVEGGAVLATPFLDIRSLVGTEGEAGLLGLAFPDDYAGSGEFFVYYVDRLNDSILARYRVSTNPDRANAASREVVLRVDQAAGSTNHRGGTIAFSPTDGMLYWALGDGGDSLTAQNPQSLLGKMLRLDVGGGPGTTYTIPPDNPFPGPNNARDEIWALGFRNPFRFSFDRQNGNLWIGDVGAGAREEVDFEPSTAFGGRNYGWPVHEGTLCNQPLPNLPCRTPSSPGPFTFPVHEYATHAGGTCAITGGVVYRGTALSLGGSYLFADFCSDRVMARRPDGSITDLTASLTPTAGRIDGVVAIGEDAYGEAYLVSMQSGDVHRISD